MHVLFIELGLTLIAFILRFIGIQNNYPFWVDEFNSGTQARLILNHGIYVFSDKSIPFEFQNITTHFIMAGFFMIFGQNEWIARLPMVILGSLLPICVYFLGKQLANKSVGLVSSILITFSYFEITWSRQARGYVLLQLLIILTIYFYNKFLQEHQIKIKLQVVLWVLILAGILTHYLYILLIIAMTLNTFWLHKKKLRMFFRPPVMLIGMIGIFILMYSTGGVQAIATFKSTNFFNANNFGYYHSFLWREYGLLTFLAIFGLIAQLLEKKDQIKYILFYIAIHLIFVTFYFSHHMSKYLLPIFPFIIIGAAISIVLISDNISKSIHNKYLKHALPVLIALFIIMNGHKFINKPKTYYSVNHDFREIANIDYNQVYKPVLENRDKNPVIIETWTARANWYLGNDYKNIYLFRWNEDGYTNGHSKRTPYYIKNGEKRITSDIGFIANADDLKNVIKKNSAGFIFIDDSSLPQDVIQYAKKNLRKELYIDHYPLDDNPYSVWPATLYSWGIK